MTTRTPTQRNISAVLAQAGFGRSYITPPRTPRAQRGAREGYTVRGAYEGVVWVRHETFSLRPDRERVTRMLKAYAAAIVSAGFAAECGSDRVVVKTKAA
jgi:hypothetical protein